MDSATLRKLIAEANGKAPRKSAYKHVVRVGRTLIYLTDEGLEQYNVAEWLRLYKIKFLHIPNEAKRSPKDGLMLKLLGLEPGASDLLIFTRTPEIGDAPGVCIEMKAVDGILTGNQIKFLADMAALGWITYTAYGANDAIAFLEGYGYGKK